MFFGGWRVLLVYSLRSARDLPLACSNDAPRSTVRSFAAEGLEVRRFATAMAVYRRAGGVGGGGWGWGVGGGGGGCWWGCTNLLGPSTLQLRSTCINVATSAKVMSLATSRTLVVLFFSNFWRPKPNTWKKFHCSCLSTKLEEEVHKKDPSVF